MGEWEALIQRLNGSLLVNGRNDIAEWSLDDSRIFSIKKLKEIIEDRRDGSIGSMVETKWLNYIPKKICVFIWKANKGRIPCRSVLDQMGIDLDSMLCPQCGDSIESVEHALALCPEVKKLWTAITKWWGKDQSEVESLQNLLQRGAVSNNNTGVNLWEGMKWVTLYLIWSHRNRIVFKEEKRKVTEVFHEVQRLSFEWMISRCRGLSTSSSTWVTWLTNPNSIKIAKQ